MNAQGMGGLIIFFMLKSIGDYRVKAGSWKRRLIFKYTTVYIPQ